MDKHYTDSFDTQVTPEESELPTSIEEIIEDDDEISFG